MAYFNAAQEEAILRAGLPPTWGFENYLDGEPPMGFFLNAPHDSPAYFSTVNGRKARRFVNNELIGSRKIFPWDARQIQRAADAIKNDCWETRKHMVKPTSYFDLYRYWDAYDLWHIGVQNAWNVLNHMYFEAQQALPGLIQGAASILDEWTREFLKNRTRRNKLFYWNPSDPTAVQYILDSVFTAEELQGLKNLDVWYFPMIQDIMLRAHLALRNGVYPPPKPIAAAPLAALNGQGDSEIAGNNSSGK
jgi:hypothetical protein